MVDCRQFRILVLGLLAWLPVCLAGEDLLWRAYTKGSADKRAELAACQDKLAAIREKARTATEAPDWATDADVLWLLSHRTPAMLAVEREIDAKPAGHYVGALAYLVGAIGNQRLTAGLPKLLPLAKTDGARLQVLQAMADHGGAKSLTELQVFLERATAGTPCEEICVAAEGLARTGNKGYLSSVRRAYMLVQSDADSVRLAAARYRCGDALMAGQILSVLKRKDASTQARLNALEFFQNNPTGEAVPVVAALAAESTDEKVAEQALTTLMHMTGYGAQLGEKADAPAGETPAENGGVAQAGPPGPEERKKDVEVVLAWWRAHPADGPIGKTLPTRADVFAGTGGVTEH